jgi:hypothetical protein
MKEEMFDPRETQVTSFALGEMSADESAKYEKSLAGDPGLKEEIGGIREMAALLQEGFGKELDAMFHPEGLAEPAPTFSVVDFAEKEVETEDVKVVPIDSFGRFSRSRAAVAALAAALVAAVAVVPMLRQQSGSSVNLAASTASLPVASLEMAAAPVSDEPLDQAVWKDPAAVRETLGLSVPGEEGVPGVSAQVESPVGFHLAGVSSGAKARSLSYVDPELLRLKSSIEAADRRIEMAKSLLKMAETSSEAAEVLRDLVSGDGFGEIDAARAESIYRSLLMAEDGQQSAKPDSVESEGTVFRYGLRDEGVSNSGGGFDLGPVWWQSAMPDGAE